MSFIIDSPSVGTISDSNTCVPMWDESMWPLNQWDLEEWPICIVIDVDNEGCLVLYQSISLYDQVLLNTNFIDEQSIDTNLVDSTNLNTSFIDDLEINTNLIGTVSFNIDFCEDGSCL